MAALKPLADALFNAHPSMYSCGGETKSVHPIPGIKVGELLLSSPVGPSQMPELIAAATPTVNNNNTWELSPTSFAITNPTWNESLEECIHDFSTNFGCKGEDTVALIDRMVIQGQDSTTFEPSIASTNPNMFAYLVVQLPSIFSGGAIEFQDVNASKTYAMESNAQFAVHAFAYLLGALKSVAPITSGYRIMLVYSLQYDCPSAIPSLNSLERAQATARDFFMQWAPQAEDKKKIIIMLKETSYPDFFGDTTNALTLLRDADKNIAKVLTPLSAAAAAPDALSFSFATVVQRKDTKMLELSLMGTSSIGSSFHLTLPTSHDEIIDGAGVLEGALAGAAAAAGASAAAASAPPSGKYAKTINPALLNYMKLHGSGPFMDYEDEYGEHGDDCSCSSCAWDDDEDDDDAMSFLDPGYGYGAPYYHPSLHYAAASALAAKRYPALVIFRRTARFDLVWNSVTLRDAIQFIRHMHALHALAPELYALDEVLQALTRLTDTILSLLSGAPITNKITKGEVLRADYEGSMGILAVFVATLSKPDVLRQFCAVLQHPEMKAWWKSWDGSLNSLHRVFESYPWGADLENLFTCILDVQNWNAVFALVRNLQHTTATYQECCARLRDAVLEAAQAKKPVDKAIFYQFMTHFLREKDDDSVIKLIAILLDPKSPYGKAKDSEYSQYILERFRYSHEFQLRYAPLRRLVQARADYLTPFVAAGPPVVTSWARPDVIIPDDPHLQAFMHGPEIETTRRPFRNISDARRFASRLHCINGVAADARGRGSLAFVHIRKVLVGAEGDNEALFNRRKQELDWLKQVLAQSDQPPTLPAPAPSPAVKNALDAPGSEQAAKRFKQESGLLKVKEEPID